MNDCRLSLVEFKINDLDFINNAIIVADTRDDLASALDALIIESDTFKNLLSFSTGT